MKTRLSIYLFALLIISAGCTNKSENYSAFQEKGVNELEDGYTPHPQPHKMPHPEINATVLETSEISANNLQSFPTPIQLLHTYLNHEDEIKHHIYDLDVMVSNHFSFHVASINENRIIMLDQSRNRLLDYDTEQNEYLDLAPEGRGPGDLLFTRDMRLINNQLYIGMQGFRISVFDCTTSPCQYDRTISTDYNNYSVAQADDKTIFLGLSSFGREQDPDPSRINQNALHVLSSDGESINSFSPVYQHSSPIVRERMNANGTVHYIPGAEKVVLTYQYYPYFYTYDINGNLMEKLKIPGFKIGFYDFNEEDGIGRFRFNDSSDITYTTLIADSWIVFQIRNRINMIREESGGVSGDSWHSYYAYNADTGNYYHIGDDHTFSTREGRAIFIVDDGIIINEGGESLSMISLK
ncbi:MAG: hypothetical protein JJU37_06205 [Balneolaceae bacterium]|nr:hypothetical protein [Balneolaceae bacterium]